MISVLEHIEYLVTKHDCVIMPGWGAFIAQYDSSYCEADGSVWHKPKREISFNGELSHNDGLLVSSIIRKTGCPYDVANAAVQDAVATYRKQLTDDGELSFGALGIFKMHQGKATFVPSSKGMARCEFYGFPTFSVTPLSALDNGRGARLDNSWRFSVNKSYMKIAASIIVLLVLSFVLTTPISVDSEKQYYASMSDLKVSSNRTLDLTPEFKELAITMPVANNDKPLMKAYSSMGGKKKAKSNYYLIVCSVLSQAEAQKFISQQKGNCDFNVLDKNGKFRVYIAAGNSIKEMLMLKDKVADSYPDAWVYCSK